MASSDLAILITARDQASGPLRAIGAQIANLGKAVALPGKALGGLMTGLGQIGLAGMGIQALTGAAQGLGSALGVGLNSSLEQTRAKLNAFTKDTALTEGLLADVREEARLGPFAFKELADATASLLPVSKASGVGLKELRQEAQILAASNPMEGMQGASFALKEAMTGDFTSIIERFNLSRSSINQWKKEGVSNFEIVKRAMKEMGLDADLVGKMGETLEGRWSTFNDTLDTLKMKISEPIFDLLKEGLMGAQQMFDDNAEAVGAFAQSVADNIKRTITIVKALWAAFTIDPGAIGIVKEQLAGMFGDEVVAGIENFLAGFMNVIPEIQRFGAEAMTTAGIVRDQLGSALEWVASTGWPGLQAGAAAAADAVTDAAAAVRGNAAALSALVGILTAAATAFALVRGAALLSAAALAVQTAATTVATAAMAALNAMITLNPIGILIVALAGGTAALITFYNTSETFRSTVERAFTAVKIAAFSMLDGIMGVVDSILGAFEGLAAGMQSIGINIGGSLAAGMRSQVGVVRAGAQALVEAAESAANAAAEIQSPSRVFAEIGKMICEGLAIGIEDGTFKAVNSMATLIDKVTEVVRDAGFGDELVGKMREAITGMDAALGLAEEHGGNITKLRREMSDTRLWNQPEALAFQSRANELDKEQLSLEREFLQASRHKEAMQREMRDAEEKLGYARDSENKRAIRRAENEVAAAKSNLKYASDALVPFETQNRLLQEREADLRLERQQWEAIQKTAELAQEAVINHEEKLKRLFEDQAAGAEDQLKNLNKVTEEFVDQTKAVDILDDHIQDLGESLVGLNFDEALRRANVIMPEIEGARAGGGPVSAGRRYLVGERGPELFTPGLSGMITPNGGGGVTVVVNVSGSVTSEGDLVECIRRGLLQVGRRNGNSALGWLA